MLRQHAFPESDSTRSPTRFQRDQGFLKATLRGRQSISDAASASRTRLCAVAKALLTPRALPESDSTRSPKRFQRDKGFLKATLRGRQSISEAASASRRRFCAVAKALLTPRALPKSDSTRSPKRFQCDKGFLKATLRGRQSIFDAASASRKRFLWILGGAGRPGGRGSPKKRF